MKRSREPRWFEGPGDSRSNDVDFRVFADQLPIMVFQQDAAGSVCFTNAAWYELTGLPRDQASYTLTAWETVVHPDDLERVVASMSEAIPTRTAYEFEYRVKKTGAGSDSYRWYVARGVPQYARGEFRGWIGSVVDIHDAHVRELAERALREAAIKSEREFRAIAEAIPVIVWRADASGAIEWYNQQWYEYTGQTAQEASGWGWQAAHHPDDFPRVMKAWTNSIATGEPFEMEFRLRRHDGVFHAFLTRVRPIHDETGRVVRWYGSNVDIQAQKAQLERSQRIAETLQAVFLPEQLPHTPSIRMDAVYQAAEKDALVGGDWFDALKLPDGRFVLSIGDVTGHGLDASIIAGRLRQAIVDFSFEQAEPAAVLDRVNRVLRYQHPDIYATALVCFIDPSCSAISYASAGHPAPIVAYEGCAAPSLPLGGVPLGVDVSPTFTSSTIPIQHDMVVALYTDGLTEFDRDIERAETDLRTAVARLVGDTSVVRPARVIRDAVLQRRPARDDLALLIVQFSQVTVHTLASDDPALRQKTWRFHSSDAYAAQLSRQELMSFVRTITDDAEGLFNAELILGEILANTVEHAPGLVEIEIDWSGDKPVLTVVDSGPGLEGFRCDLPSDPFDESGRGLFLIGALTEELHVEKARGFGTELRVVLPLTRTTAPTVAD